MIKFLLLNQMPIEEQLALEKDLLKKTSDNFFIINTGAKPTIVMGLSSQASDWVDVDLAKERGIPIISRFSGGGTVFIDENTIFATFIMNKSSLHIDPYPKNILQWTSEFYKEALGIENFSLRENDYTIGDKKIGGNAQYLQKDRWLHHTSFLYDYHPENMKLLLHPKRTPEYREGRCHTDFLTTLKPHLTMEDFIQKTQLNLLQRAI